MKKIIFLILSMYLSCFSLPAQERYFIDFQTYIRQVQENNHEYVAEVLNIDIAQAQYEAASVFIDPEISVGYSNNEDWTRKMGQGFNVEISKDFSFGKRKARMDLASHEKELARALAQHFYRELRADATIAYLNSFRLLQYYQAKKGLSDKLRKLVEVDSISYTNQKISLSDFMQSRLEWELLSTELMKLRNELTDSFLELNVFTGHAYRDTLLVPKEDLEMDIPQYSLDSLLQIAYEKRTDLQVALKEKDCAEKAVKLAKRERNVDVNLLVGYLYASKALNPDAFSPSYNGIYVGASVPIPFSHSNKGSIRKQEQIQRQKELLYQQAVVEITAEVRSAYDHFNSLRRQIAPYDGGLMRHSGKLLDDRIGEYIVGETTLMEVFYAYHTYEFILKTRLDMEFKLYSSLIQLKKISGIWG